MFLFATQAEPQMLEFAHPHLGRLAQPRCYSRIYDTARRGVLWAADNDAFNGGVDTWKFLKMLDTIDGLPGCRFVAVPDVVADAAATLREFARWLPFLLHFDLPLAFVLQDGIAAAEVPWGSIDAVFIGGSDSFKLGAQARRIAGEAQRRGKWVHMVGSTQSVGSPTPARSAATPSTEPNGSDGETPTSGRELASSQRRRRQVCSAMRPASRETHWPSHEDPGPSSPAWQ